tara:strand:+ start:76893 stop:77126 length:234 start_codon:yes stop_codon:yes gene_type:complete
MKQPQYKISSRIKIKSNKKSSKLVEQSIKQDIEETDSVFSKNESLILEINAKEISELRAKLSSHVRAANVSYDIVLE